MSIQIFEYSVTTAALFSIYLNGGGMMAERQRVLNRFLLLNLLLNLLSDNVKIFIQWVPSHVNINRNDIADGLAREGRHKDSVIGACLTFSEIATQVKQDISSSWSVAFLRTGSRRDETTLVRFNSGHTGAQWHVESLKVYFSCPNCIVT
ncbi:RNase H domain-containing protein [Trichonephila clavipes]|nr:RNase H domain-containing protein [Trichonephila clavipes]